MTLAGAQRPHRNYSRFRVAGITDGISFAKMPSTPVVSTAVVT